MNKIENFIQCKYANSKHNPFLSPEIEFPPGHRIRLAIL